MKPKKAKKPVSETQKARAYLETIPARRDALLTTSARKEWYDGRIGQINHMCRDWTNWEDKSDGPFNLKAQQECEEAYNTLMPRIFRWARKYYDWSWANYHPSEKAEMITGPLTKEEATLAAYCAIDRIVCILDDSQVEHDEDGEPILCGDREQFQRDFEGDGDCGFFHATEVYVLREREDGKGLEQVKVKTNYLKQLKARYEKALRIVEEDLEHAEQEAPPQAGKTTSETQDGSGGDTSPTKRAKRWTVKLANEVILPIIQKYGKTPLILTARFLEEESGVPKSTLSKTENWDALKKIKRKYREEHGKMQHRPKRLTDKMTRVLGQTEDGSAKLHTSHIKKNIEGDE